MFFHGLLPPSLEIYLLLQTTLSAPPLSFSRPWKVAGGGREDVGGCRYGRWLVADGETGLAVDVEGKEGADAVVIVLGGYMSEAEIVVCVDRAVAVGFVSTQLQNEFSPEFSGFEAPSIFFKT